MEYERTDDSQIQAAFARRVGKVLLQYEAGACDLAPADQHEATLLICLLQAVLTQCTEAMRRKGGPLRAELDAVLNVKLKDQPPRFGFDEACIDVWGHSSGPPTYRELITVVRNALSHPTVQAEVEHPTTGYTTVLDDTGLIQNFRFIVSPWVNSAGKPKGTQEQLLATTMKKAKRVLAPDQAAKLQWRIRHGNNYLELEGRPFVPHTMVTLSVLQLRTLTLELSDLLGADSGSQSADTKGRDAQRENVSPASLIVQGAPDGRG
jgi:hypothetical protein